MAFKASGFLLYKGHKSSDNFDGEPSMSNGIMCQLPSSHLFIHRVPAKLLTGSCPTERTTAGYDSCLYLDFTDLPVPKGMGIPWTLALSQYYIW